ncbi:translation initiation factor IF-2 [Anaplasma capra]|uniref:translation initiation factor IF-2 n=1 Tax=Anaplasma capra TaxID=1562740 RepID=UPI0021D5D497|nr:translation initiation factor IF-2 [Anaplasma capra]MCU7611597.1 translation initiation factor IF-2 [Anaplasma capra]MCU7611963.1 translation initiation factor IF-2 [Anaplasma capra]
MSDVEKFGESCGGPSGGRERLTLKLGVRAPATLTKTPASAGGKPFMTVEVRSKKRKAGETPPSDGVKRLITTPSGSDSSKQRQGSAVGSLTAKEQLSRINAIHTADSISAQEKAAKKLRSGTESAPDVAAPVEEESSSEGDGAAKGPAPAAADAVLGPSMLGDAVAGARPGKGGYEDKNKRYSSQSAGGRVREKEGGGAKKAVASRASSKHIKLDIENALSGVEERHVLRSSSRRRGGSRNVHRISREVIIPDEIEVKALASAMAEKVGDVLRILAHMGIDARQGAVIESGVASEIAEKFGHRPKIVSKTQMERELCDIGDDDLELQPRPPVVTVMGHVDHGKTSLLDVLRKSNVAEREFRGITQHIGAYQIEVDGKKITFLDTPGHEAFSDMRARGTNVTDIVVLVVAADDGIMPQTVESINHVRAAGVSMIVAVNKIDKSGANVEKITNDLLQHGVVSENLGGDTMIVPVSAKTGENLDKLKLSILLLAEMLELQAPVECRAQGVVIESKVERSCGVVATVIVQKGTLRKGNIVVAGDGSYGKVRNMFDDGDNSVDVAPPSMPVKVLGLDKVPKAGDTFLVMPSEKHARDLLERRAEIHFSREARKSGGVFMGPVFPVGEAIEEVNMILKADVAGSLEAVARSVAQIEHEEVKFNILHKDIGDVTRSDVLLAEASSAVVLAFNVKVDAQARDLVRQKDVDIRHHRVIYDLIDDVKGVVCGKLKPIVRETQVGSLVVREVFSSGKGGIVVGCYVSEGAVSRGASVRIYRNDSATYEGKVKALRRFKDDVKEVSHGLECGILVEGVKDVAVGDVIKVLEVVEHARVVE